MGRQGTEVVSGELPRRPSCSIAQLVDNYRPVMDGVGVCVENYAREIDRRHGRVKVVTPWAPGPAPAEEYEVMRYRSIPLIGRAPYRVGIPFADPRFVSKYMGSTFDLVHSHTPFASGLLAEKYARAHDVPHVTTFHSKYRDDMVGYFKSASLADWLIAKVVRFYDRCEHVWTESPSTAAVLRSYGYQGDLLIAPNGTDFKAPSAARLAALRQEGRGMAQVPEQDILFLFVGQHRWEKNVRLILDAYGALRRILQEKHRGGVEVPDFTAVFVGDGHAAPQMKRIARDQGIAGQTRFLGKLLDRADMERIYAAADLFVFPSHYDNSPVTVREAAAFGVPPVLVNGSTSAEDIRDRENGFLTSDDPAYLAGLLAELMADGDARARAGEGARQTFYRTWEDIVAWAVEQYDRILDAHQTKARSGGNPSKRPVNSEPARADASEG